MKLSKNLIVEFFYSNSHYSIHQLENLRRTQRNIWSQNSVGIPSTTLSEDRLLPRLFTSAREPAPDSSPREYHPVRARVTAHSLSANSHPRQGTHGTRAAYRSRNRSSRSTTGVEAVAIELLHPHIPRIALILLHPSYSRGSPVDSLFPCPRDR